jgi:hypothetical protein
VHGLQILAKLGQQVIDIAEEISGRAGLTNSSRDTARYEYAKALAAMF